MLFDIKWVFSDFYCTLMKHETFQYTSYSFNFWGWEFINCYQVSFLVEYIYIFIYACVYFHWIWGDKSFITWVLHIHVSNTSTFYCHIFLHVIVVYLCLWRLFKANYMFNVTQASRFRRNYCFKRKKKTKPSHSISFSFSF